MRFRMTVSGASHRWRRDDWSRLSCNGRSLQELIEFRFEPSLSCGHEEVHQYGPEQEPAESDQPRPERCQPPDHALHLLGRVFDCLGGAGDLSIQIQAQLVHTFGDGLPRPDPGAPLDAGLKRLEFPSDSSLFLHHPLTVSPLQ